jgi:hypothetical protein
MERAVENLGGRGVIERVPQLGGNPDNRVGRRGTRISDHHVQGFGGDEILGQERMHTGEAGRQRRRNAGMREIGGDQLLELGDELVRFLRRQVEPEQFDRNETILFGLICAEHRAQRARTDLMEYTKRPESVGGRSAGCVRVQRRYSSKEGT